MILLFSETKSIVETEVIDCIQDILTEIISLLNIKKIS